MTRAKRCCLAATRAPSRGTDKDLEGRLAVKPPLEVRGRHAAPSGPSDRLAKVHACLLFCSPRGGAMAGVSVRRVVNRIWLSWVWSLRSDCRSKQGTPPNGEKSCFLNPFRQSIMTPKSSKFLLGDAVFRAVLVALIWTSERANVRYSESAGGPCL
ncbi:uncharacterized protein LY79DRAFT_46814 [Colletotrichum navitas]|uniref:Uncharacterized protein n=1 Tax=Colletotrichum navitas TaxID=681940 RepID=A0AAD8UZU8_9PEZI|nr:uncharacterized protein LY79DRAFT_46814 [Colletotrichum navitas]KAK1570258.1 hypothetical protein LY79DRAFT_46814 [Colletotrichum navitas]